MSDDPVKRKLFEDDDITTNYDSPIKKQRNRINYVKNIIEKRNKKRKNYEETDISIIRNKIRKIDNNNQKKEEMKNNPMILQYVSKVYTNGFKYNGTEHDGKRDGFGKLIFPSGGFLEGHWTKDKIIGNFTYKDENNNSLFKGYLNNGIKNGYGVISYKSGNKYEGNWINDKKDGYGKYYLTNGITIEGNWEDDKLDSISYTEYKDGTFYIGKMYNNKRHGHGKFICKDLIIEGKWIDDKPFSYMKITYEKTNVVKFCEMNDKMQITKIY